MTKKAKKRLAMTVAFLLLAVGSGSLGFSGGKLITDIQHEELAIHAELDLVKMLDGVLKENSFLKKRVDELVEIVGDQEIQIADLIDVVKGKNKTIEDKTAQIDNMQKSMNNMQDQLDVYANAPPPAPEIIEVIKEVPVYIEVPVEPEPEPEVVEEEDGNDGDAGDNSNGGSDDDEFDDGDNDTNDGDGGSSDNDSDGDVDNGDCENDRHRGNGKGHSKGRGKGHNK